MAGNTPGDDLDLAQGRGQGRGHTQGRLPDPLTRRLHRTPHNLSTSRKVAEADSGRKGRNVIQGHQGHTVPRRRGRTKNKRRRREK